MAYGLRIPKITGDINDAIMICKNNIYLYFKLEQATDVNKLIALIKENGNFKASDYRRFMKQAAKTTQPSRIQRRLKIGVLPLVGTARFVPSTESTVCSTSTTIKTNENEMWSKSYNAQDFKIEDGAITIGKYVLKSVRIKKTHPSWLVNIEHIFKIAPERDKKGRILPNRFHFVPYTDLSFLLHSIEEQQNKQTRKKEIENIYNLWEQKLQRYLLMAPPLYYHPFYILKKLSEYEIKSDDTNSSQIMLWDNYHIYKPNLCVPINDVDVEDGKICVCTKNISFVKQPYKRHSLNESFDFPNEANEILYEGDKDYITTPSWGGFYRVLCRQFDESIISDVYDDLQNKYHQYMESLINQVKSIGNIEFKTYLSKEGFQSRQIDSSKIYLFLDQNKNLNLPFISNRIIWTYKEFWKVIFTSDLFEYSQNTLKNIAIILDSNWDVVKPECNWILTNEVPITHELTKEELYPDHSCYNTISHNIFADIIRIRKVTEYYASRIQIPGGYSCQDYNILFFIETANHISDLYNNTYGGNFTSFIIWPKGENANSIRLYPTNPKYANYIFYVNTTVCSLETASYMIWRYFSSNHYNKRQEIKSIKLFQLFGIYKIKKF